MFPSKMRSLGVETVLKVAHLNNYYADENVRLECAVDNGLRVISFRSENRLFLKGVRIAQVPYRISSDDFRIVLNIMDTGLNEVLLTCRFNLSRNPNQPRYAMYFLDVEPVELCPKVRYQILITIEETNPENSRLATVVDVEGAESLIRFQYFQCFLNKEVIMDKLFFMS